MKFSGNIALLKNQSREIELEAGTNIQVENDTISTVHIPTFGDVLLDSEDKLITELLDEKYSIQPNLELAPNSISLNLGSVNGLQTPTTATQAVNKKYVDDTLTYFWEQLQNFNYLNFKGEYNSNLTYKTGDLVISDNFFYLSLIDLNNEPLTNEQAWTKMSSALNGDLVTQDQLRQSLTIILTELNNKLTEQDNKINENMTAIAELQAKLNLIESNITDLRKVYYLEINMFNTSAKGRMSGFSISVNDAVGNLITPEAGSTVRFASNRGFTQIREPTFYKQTWNFTSEYIDVVFPTSENNPDAFNDVLVQCKIIIKGLVYRCSHWFYTMPYNFEYNPSQPDSQWSMRIPLIP